jgi:uncharacterized protein
MKRSQFQTLTQDLEKKMVFLTGPRQVGKTTLARSLKEKWPQLYYLNYDADQDRKVIREQAWDRQTPLVVFDEVHKLKSWKTKLKGVYDTEGIPPRILVTGSARLDIFRRGGDSLAGRYFLHRLYPFSVRELRGQAPPGDILEQLMEYGGFPEPFLSQSQRISQRWRRQHLERIVRIDIQDLEPVRDIQTLLLLVDLLRERVGSPLSYTSLARNLEISPHTVKHWIQTLANMYVIFIVPPYHKNRARALLKAPKVYFYDTGAVVGDRGVRLENAVANCLMKHLHFLEDTQGIESVLYYYRDKEKREVDFVTSVNHKIDALIEVKLNNESLSPGLRYLKPRLPARQYLQLVHGVKRTRNMDGITIHSAGPWLDTLDI